MSSAGNGPGGEVKPILVPLQPVKLNLMNLINPVNFIVLNFAGSRMAEDEVDKSITVMSSRPDPEGQTGSSPSSPNTSDCSGDRPGPAVTPGGGSP